MVNVRSTALSILLALAWEGGARAEDNVLYRCTDGQGTIVFSNSRQGYQDCREVGRYPRPAAASARVAALGPASAAPTAAPPPAVGSVSTTPTLAPQERGSTRQGAVYRYERDGVVHYTNVRPAGTRADVVFTYTIENCVACQVDSRVDWQNVPLNLDGYRQEIALAALEHGVDEALIRAIIHAESAYQPHARSHKGAQGLMQLIPATATRFGVTDAFDPAQNIAGGVRYLAWLLDRFNGDVRLATAGYNAGEGAVERHGGVPPYAETQVYVDRVAILHARYRAALDALAGVRSADGESAQASGSAAPSAGARLIGTVQ
jgi:soluble lytic murein transglycosylase-like protein